MQNRTHYSVRESLLKQEVSSWIDHWRDLSRFVLPRSQRFLSSDRNKGTKNNQNILDNTAYIALRTMGAGFMSGVTNPTRPWFGLKTPDPDLNKFKSAKVWLDSTRARLSDIMLMSNLYTVLPRIYGDNGLYATAAMSLLEDQDSVIRAAHQPIGSYMIGTDHRGVVNTFYRTISMTVGQMMGSFDHKNISAGVRNLADHSSDSWVEVVHAVEPNEEYKSGALQARYKRFKSVYYERNSKTSEEDFLRVSGFDEFPIICPRWEVYGEDIYGSDSPGMVSLPDVRGLQVSTRRKLQILDKFTEPPMNAPMSMEGRQKSLMSGDVNYVDALTGQQGFTPTFQIANPHLSDLTMDLAETRERINMAFYRDLFLMLANDTRGDKTATEIAARQEEKMLALSPTYLRLNDEMLDPLIDRTFNMALRAGLIETPPPELQNVPLSVEYVSTMSQAMKMIGVSSVERLLTFTGNMSQAFPQVLDKIDPDEVVDIYSDMVGTPPSMVRDNKTAGEIRQKRAEDTRAAQMMESAQKGAAAVRDLANSPVSDDNALSQLLSRMGSAQATGA